jgi:uncharacterized protein YoxC
MKNQLLTPEIEIDDEGISMINSFNKLSEENMEVIATIEALKKQSTMINSCYSDILKKTNKLLVLMNELVLLTK